MFLSNISIKRPVMISMVLAALLLFGLMAFIALPLNLTPNVEFPFVVIQTVYPGASPDQIESQITDKIEDEVSTISNISYIQSFSLDSASIVLMRFDLSKDQDVAHQEVKSKIDNIINEFPDDAEDPIVEKFDITASPVIDVMLSGNVSMQELYDLADGRVKELFSQVENVGSVSLTGGQEREIRVEFDNRTVFQNRISLVQVNQIIKSSNMNMPGGYFQQEGQEYSVKLDGEFSSLRGLEEIEIPTASGSKKLRQIADIIDSGEEIREKAIYFNNETKVRNSNAILLSVVKNSEGNAVKIVKEVKEVINEINKDLPAGVTLEIINERADYVQSSVSDTITNIILGIIFTSFVLLFFLHDFRSTLIIVITMPASLIPTFLCFNMMGFSLNIMTLMGLSTSVGLLVMNSVVVLENIFRHKEMGHSRKEAAAKGTSEVTVAVLASTLTNLAVFLPLATMDGIIGMFLREFALAVTFATVFSLLIAFTLTPMMASFILPEHTGKKNRIGEYLESMFKRWEAGYKKALTVILSSKKKSLLVIASAIIIFVIAMSQFGKIQFEFMPFSDEGEIELTLELPQGYDIEETENVTKIIEKRLSEYGVIKHIVTELGKTSEINTGTNLSRMTVTMIPKEDREIASNVFAAIITEDLSDIPGADIKVAAVSGMGGGGDKPVDFYLTGHDTEKLENYKNILFEALSKREGFMNLDTSSREGKPEITIIPDRKKLNDAGLTIYDLAVTMRSAVEGMVMTQFKESGNEYDIRVVLKDDAVKSYEDVKNISIASAAGIYPVSHFAEVRYTTGYNKVLHYDKVKSIEFTADIMPGFAQGELMNIVDEEVEKLDLPFGYKKILAGSSEEMQSANIAMAKAFITAIILTYMLLAAILEKVSQPFLILFTVPLSLIGVVAAFLITGKNMNFISMMAIVMLIGLVVNNAILILDYANQLKSKGMSMREALIEACPVKLKPILMSNIAAILGMLPMAMGIGSAGAEMRQPMGIVSIGGLATATLLTLFVIPSMENLMTRSKKKKEVKETVYEA